MLQKTMELNADYKNNLEIHYFALLNLMVNEQHSEAKSTYPILFNSNYAYLEQQSIVIRALNEEQKKSEREAVKKYFNDIGYQAYCEAILASDQEKNSFLWLGIDEITLLCKEFNINLIINGTDYSKSNAQNKLFVNNETGTHWERIVYSEELVVSAQKFYDKHFFNTYLSLFI